MPSPDSHGRDILLLGHLKSKKRTGVKKQTLHQTNHQATACLKGKLSITCFLQWSCFLTVDGVDLNAPEVEREKLYYFRLTEVSHSWP